MKRFVLIGLSSLLLSLSVPAIVDTNNDGISDLWERQYNGDQLFDPPIDPAADPDSDGWTNAQEAAAGTNPFDANPPSGFLRPDIINIPAVWEDVNGNPVLVTPNTIRVSWQTIPGKQYTLLYSPDLTASSWLPVEGAYIGNGTITEYNFPLIDPTSNFWRVTIEDVDTDGDGVSDAEEYVYGTNPNNAATIAGIPDLWLASNFPSVLQNGGLSTFDPNADADGDSLTNSEELAAGTNPNSVDTDGDGLNDDEDAVPNDAEINWPKTPETRYVWIPQVATTGAKALSKYGHILFPSNNGGSSNLSALHVLWDSNTSSWVNLTGASSWSGSGFHSGNTPDVFDAEWLHIDDMNDEGVVVGRSKVIGPDVPVAWVLAPAIMKWQISGTALNQYADPIYIVPGFEYVDPWGDLEKALVGEAPRIADDGTVSALSYYVEAGNLPVDIEWVASGAQVASHSKEMTMWANFDLDSNIQYRSGGLIGASGGLLVEHHPSLPKTVLHYRNGANLESLEGLLPSTVYGIDNTDIGRTPPTSESPGGRIWFSVNHDGGNVVFLEKRNGGSGISRWHNIPSMADGAVRINARGEAITRGSSYLTPSATPKIWRNGKYTELNEISSKPASVTITNAIDLASNGMILAQAVENGVAKTGLLLPVEVVVRKKGDVVPTNGVLVKTQDVMEFALAPSFFDAEDNFESLITWQFRQRKADGTYENWVDAGGQCTGTKFECAFVLPGIFQVKAVISNGGEYEYKRKKDEKIGNLQYGPGKKDQPDCIGICSGQIQLDICREAQNFYGSEEYASSNVLSAQYGFPEYPASGNSIIRCNIFVAHRATAAGALVPKINGFFNEYPPLANEWAGIEDTSILPGDPTYIASWTILPPGTHPQPGCIIAHPQPGDAGHCAITDYDGEGIGAGISGTANKNYDEFWDGTSRFRKYQP